ncbi:MULTISPECIES: riboflavin synthase [unclassified Apibacter]|uniref:riboflavin synthase n=1 Tax=unclassified Apibacter TaxID=2630820 RepID=UPI00135EACD4|nr:MULTISPECIES: riboflavin synthase [unclassified Apibacter]MXP06261.1 riboflavin synthase [Apibacter sp. B3546]MXP12061.1 riboflavin synthase [Apibacter sp. B3239]
MFTGIVEEMGKIVNMEKIDENLSISISASFIDELKIDQSIAHNGTCLTVVDINPEFYTVTAIAETLKKTHFSTLTIGDHINLERCVKVSDRLDGHIVQGHVDQVGELKSIENQEGSFLLTFTYAGKQITVEKGSITVNGVSLTVVDSKDNEFSVAIIPYTWDHTNFKYLKIGDKVNLEFDIIGKYIQKLYGLYK